MKRKVFLFVSLALFGWSVSAQIMLKDIYTGASSSSPNYFTNVNNLLYFTANDGTGSKVWQSDGTVNGTVKLGASVSNVTPFYNINGILYYVNFDSNGQELWKTDGTVSGTALVKDIYSGFSNGLSTTPSFTSLNDTLYFMATNGTNGNELWKSDGTAAGTVMVKDIRSGAAASTPSYIININGTLYFSANDGTNGTELWKSDGTAAGTVMVKDIQAGGGNSSPSFLISINGTIYFRANDGTGAGIELWKSDGTDAGTVMVKDINPSGDSYSSTFTYVNGVVYFIATDGTNGYELWKSNGTDAGTVMVKDIYVGTSGSTPQYLTGVGSTLFFRANDGVNGTELWKSDGTADGTVLVKDIVSGAGSSFPTYLISANGNLYFSAGDANGNELWKSDGTTAGTVMVQDIVSGAGSSSPVNIINISGSLYFRATNGTSGNELFKYGPCTPFSPVISGSLNYCSGASTVLDAGSYFSYSWSTTETTQTISAIADTYSVTVTDGNGCTGTSADVIVTELANPVTVTGLSITELTPYSAKLKWNRVSDAVQYKVSYRVKNVTTWKFFNVAGTDTFLLLNNILLPDTQYFWRVKAVNATSCLSSLFASSNFRTPVETCFVPANLSSSNITTSGAQLNWNASAGATQYYINYRVQGTTPWTLDSSETQGSTYSVLNGLAAGTTYEWKVKTFCSAVSKSKYSAINTFVTLAGRMEAKKSEEKSEKWKVESGKHDERSLSVDLFPNPAKENVELFISSSQNETVNIVVKDVLGRSVKTFTGTVTEGTNSITMSLSTLPAGMYITTVEFKSSGERMNKMLFVE